VATTEIGQILSDVNEIITDLLRLSQAMRKPAPHDRFLKSVSTDTSHFYEHDKRHVEDKFSLAEPFLLLRLGKANSWRRQYFKHRENHHNKLVQGLLTDHEDATTIASSLPSQFERKEGSAINITNFIDDDTGSESGLSQTSHAPSEWNATRPHIPSLASKYMDGKPFECPLCFYIIKVTSSHAWK
jgi:hypothetical protein